MKIKSIQRIEKLLNTNFRKVNVSKITDWKPAKTTEYSIDINGNITGLCIARHGIKEIQPIVKWLHETQYLTHLNFQYNNINDISPLKEFKNLIKLHLGDNDISDIFELEELKNLEYLNFSWNKSFDISPLSELKQLTKLYLGGSRPSDFSPLKDLKNLISIYLNSTKFSNISVLKELKKLEVIHLPGNKITDISPLQGLKKITTLFLWSNEITDISPLKGLKELTELQLRSNKISDISPLCKLTNLTNLNIWDNKITDISPLRELKNLETLDIRQNLISILPDWICDFAKMDIKWSNSYADGSISIYNNPIEVPPLEIIKQGNEIIKGWFKQQKKYGKEKVYEAKILVVGEPEAGKTSLINKIFNENHPIPGEEKEQSTLGVEIRSIKKFLYQKDKKNEIVTNFWDFGGQNIQYALHQYFISPEALYILVHDYRSEKTHFSYWFQTISMIGAKQSRVIVLLNKFKNVTSASDFDINSYRRDFPNLSSIC